MTHPRIRNNYSLPAGIGASLGICSACLSNIPIHWVMAKTSRPTAKGLTVGTKLFSVIASLLLIAITVLTFFSLRLFQEEHSYLVQKLNSHEARSRANQVTLELETIVFKAHSFEPLLSPRGNIAAVNATKSDLELLFSQFSEFLAVATIELNSEGEAQIIGLALNSLQKVADEGVLHAKLESALTSKESLRIHSIEQNQVTRVDFDSGKRALAIRVPLTEKSRAFGFLVGLGSIESFFKRSDGVTSYLVDASGSLLAHSDKLITPGEKSNLPGIMEMLTSPLNNRQLTYGSSAEGKARMAAFRQTGFAQLGVVAEVPEEVALEASQRVMRTAIWVALVAVFSAMIVGSIHSSSIVSPILKLIDAARAVADGNLETRVPVNSGKGDEISQLSHVFNEMTKGLQERQRFRDTFVKFHSKEVADKILSGDVKLGGDKLDAVILFTDLRGFTSLSDSIRPDVIVEVLNEYMARMVKVIRKHGGIIDKFIGDSIMATWGVPFGSKDDAVNAVAACLEMREELKLLNASRRERWRDPLEMGMGLNLGAVVAGNIGSEERMEYTVIGDTVNLASRLEALSKELKVDLVVSESIRNAAGARFEFQTGPKLKIRGKAEELRVYLLPDRAATIRSAA